MSAVQSVSGVLAPQFQSLSAEDRAMVEKFNNTKIANFEVPLEQIRFLMSGGLAYQIAFFMNSTNRGEDLHKLRKADDGSILMSFDDQFVAIEFVMEMVGFDKQREVFISKEEDNVEWTYISPQGFVQRSLFNYEHLVPIEEIGHDEYQQLLTHANEFWSDSHPEVDPGVEKKCVLQIVTTNRMHSDDRFMGPLLTAYPEHTTFRLFTSDQKLYSFGLQMEAEEMKEIFNGSYPFTFAKTTTTRISTPDYEEARPFHLKRATSIPITDERLQSIIKFIEEKNSSNLTFNFIRQNCATMTREILKQAGVEMNVRVPIAQAIYKILPNLEDVPHVGPILKAVVTQIQMIFDKVINVIDSIPPIVMQTLSIAAAPVTTSIDSVRFIASKIVIILSNCLVMILGGCTRSSRSPAIAEGEDNLDNQNGLTSFSKLIRSWDDFWRDDLLSIDVHLSVSEWQARQKTTHIHHSDDTLRLRYLPV